MKLPILLSAVMLLACSGQDARQSPPTAEAVRPRISQPDQPPTTRKQANLARDTVQVIATIRYFQTILANRDQERLPQVLSFGDQARHFNIAPENATFFTQKFLCPLLFQESIRQRLAHLTYREIILRDNLALVRLVGKHGRDKETFTLRKGQNNTWIIVDIFGI